MFTDVALKDSQNEPIVWNIPLIEITNHFCFIDILRMKKKTFYESFHQNISFIIIHFNLFPAFF